MDLSDSDPHAPEGETDERMDGEPELADTAPRVRPSLVLAVTAAVLFAVAAIVLAVLLATDSDGASEDLRATAGRFGAALVTYDYHDPEAHRDAVLGYATGSFRQEYEDAFDQGLGQVITEVKAVSTGYVKEVYLSAIDEERAQAIVVVDIEHEGTSGPNTLYDVYFRLTMVRVEGTWKVDQVTDLNFDSPSGPVPSEDPAAGASTSTSTSLP